MDFSEGAGPSQEKALQARNAGSLQERQLLVCLDALRDHGDANGPTDLADGGNDQSVDAAMRQVGDIGASILMQPNGRPRR